MFIDNRLRNSEIAVLAFEGNIKNEIIAKFNNNYLIEGDHIKNGGKASKVPLLSLLGAGGALGVSTASSGTLFMATANPTTLMAIGDGVGSAVMGASGIVAQAPFIQVTGAIIPVVAPLIAFQVISTISIMNQFKSINERLDKIEAKINQLIKRVFANDIGIIISASHRIIDLEHQFSICNSFSNDMIIRLALIEDRINPIFEKYSYLLGSRVKDKSLSLEDVSLQQNDAIIAILGSILDLRTDLLKLRLTVQENPGYLETAAKILVAKVENYSKLWEDISSMKYELWEISSDIDETISQMNWWQKSVPSWILGKREERKELENRSKKLKEMTVNISKKFDRDVIDAINFGKVIKNNLSGRNEMMDLIYWEDEKGVHSYYTDDLKIVPRK